MKRGCLIWALAIIVVIVGIIVVMSIMRKNAPTIITKATVTRGKFIREVSGTGNIDAKIYALTFPRPGRVERILVQEGSRVKKGAVVAELSTNKEQEDLAFARQDLQARGIAIAAFRQKSAAERTKLEADLRDARRKLGLAQNLHTAGATSADEVRDLQRRVDDLESDLRTHETQSQSSQRDLLAQRAMREAEILGYERVLRESKLIAPVSGLVSKINFRIGETASGALELVEESTIRAKAQISEAEAPEVTIGMPATIELDSNPEKPLQAVVEKLGVVATIKGEGSSATLPITLRFLPGDYTALARSGYTITARVKTQEIANATQVTLEALVDTEKMSKREAYLWVIDTATNTVSKKLVKVIARNLTTAIIDGVKEGTTVVTLPPDTLKEGARVAEDPRKLMEKK